MKKRVLIILIVLLASFFIGRHIFWYYKYDGNLLVYISNQSDLDTVAIELYIDEQMLIEDYFTNEYFHNYKMYPLRSSLGKHTLLIKNKDKSTSKEININLFFMKWVIVDFIEDDTINNKGKYTFYITTQRKPLIIE